MRLNYSKTASIFYATFWLKGSSYQSLYILYVFHSYFFTEESNYAESYKCTTDTSNWRNNSMDEYHNPLLIPPPPRMHVPSASPPRRAQAMFSPPRRSSPIEKPDYEMYEDFSKCHDDIPVIRPPTAPSSSPPQRSVPLKSPSPPFVQIKSQPPSNTITPVSSPISSNESQIPRSTILTKRTISLIPTPVSSYPFSKSGRNSRSQSPPTTLAIQSTGARQKLFKSSDWSTNDAAETTSPLRRNRSSLFSVNNDDLRKGKCCNNF